MDLPTLNEICVSYRHHISQPKKITHSQEVFEIANEIFKDSGCELQLKEYFFIILLNRNNIVIGYHKLSEGGLTGTVADIRIAFATALKCLASAIILVHNHPSGNLKPSKADNTLTQKFREAGKLMDIEVLDHLIVTSSTYYSFADEI